MSDDPNYEKYFKLVYSNFYKRLVETGDLERLKLWLTAKLDETGWRGILKRDFIEYVQDHYNSQYDSEQESNESSEGTKETNWAIIEELTDKFLVKAKDRVPLNIKTELLQRLKTIISRTHSTTFGITFNQENALK
ncbi:transcription and mRNA export factor ENY2-like [Schistocerca gregaria]|uniref:transcription and mRNA export factor ENY2-like n=1 Tax=Schistocerca gregaria TaxID=7010 RepID=UPI00211DDE34|nr:transcription and mRNA export factor ENY2-like [Schistocerca gregaria]